ncbi:MAG: hypothetical protein QXV69_04330 [Sulfolobaceae archaeon]
MRISEYYIYVVLITMLLIILFLSLAPFVPINEPLFFNGVNLFLPVGVSFSAALALFSFIIIFLLFSTSKNVWINILIDSTALTFSILNYINIFLIWSIWHPSLVIIPFFLLIFYNGSSALWLDFGQIILLIFFYRLYKNYRSSRRPRPLSGSDSTVTGDWMKTH